MKLGKFLKKIENYTTEQKIEIPIGCDAEIIAVYVTHENTFTTAQEIEVYSLYGDKHKAIEIFDTCTSKYTVRPVSFMYDKLISSENPQKVFIRLGNSLGETNTSYITITYNILK